MLSRVCSVLRNNVRKRTFSNMYVLSSNYSCLSSCHSRNVSINLTCCFNQRQTNKCCTYNNSFRFARFIHSEDVFREKEPSLEKQLVQLMEKWEMQNAVKLFSRSVKEGKLPHNSIVLNLLQQLGNLGDFESLLSLREMLMNNKLCSVDNFYNCLNTAYFNAGRISEAVLLLRIIYHDIRKFEEVDIFFTLVVVMLLEKFPNQINLIESFVKDCRENEPSDFRPTAALWKCLVLTQNFSKADNLLKEHYQIQQFIAQNINDIIHRKNKVIVERSKVLEWLLNSPHGYVSKDLHSAIFIAILDEYVDHHQWEAANEYLRRVIEDGIALPAVQVEQLKTKAEKVFFNEELDSYPLIDLISNLESVLLK